MVPSSSIRERPSWSIDERPGDIVERFFLEVVRLALNRRVRSLVMWEAFLQWCADRVINIAVSHAMFGRLARWRKDRIGGAVWYLDCELAEGYADLIAVRDPKALPRLGMVPHGDGKERRREGRDDVPIGADRQRGRDGRPQFWYFRRNGCRRRLPGLPHSVQFMEAYWAVLKETDHASGAACHAQAGRSQHGTGSFGALVRDYLKSAKFKEKANTTRAEYRRVLEALAELHGAKPVRNIRYRHVRKMRDERAETPGTANTIVRMLKLLLNFAVREEWIEYIPAAKMELLKVGEWRSWTDEECAQFVARWAPGTMERRAYALALYTGQRKRPRADGVRPPQERRNPRCPGQDGQGALGCGASRTHQRTEPRRDRAHEPADDVAKQGLKSGLLRRLVRRCDRGRRLTRGLRAARTEAGAATRRGRLHDRGDQGDHRAR